MQPLAQPRDHSSCLYAPLSICPHATRDAHLARRVEALGVEVKLGTRWRDLDNSLLVGGDSQRIDCASKLDAMPTCTPVSFFRALDTHAGYRCKLGLGLGYGSGTSVRPSN